MRGQPESTSPSETSPSELPSSGGEGSSRCSGCLVPDCPAENGPQGSGLAGWRLGLVSMGLFLGPVVLAIIGAAGFRDNPGGQFAGAIAGLGLGLAGSVGMARILHRSREIAN